MKNLFFMLAIASYLFAGCKKEKVEADNFKKFNSREERLAAISEYFNTLRTHHVLKPSNESFKNVAIFNGSTYFKDEAAVLNDSTVNELLKGHWGSSVVYEMQFETNRFYNVFPKNHRAYWVLGEVKTKDPTGFAPGVMLVSGVPGQQTNYRVSFY